MDRRSFIKLTAITGTSATLAGCGVPEHQLIRFVSDEELPPGIAEWKPSVCPLCASGCGVNVRVMPADVETMRDGQAGVVRVGVAKKLEGLAAHPVNQGGLCARGQAGIQATYHPDRIAQPLKRKGTRGDGDFEPITWEQAIGELVGQLDAVQAADPKGLTILSGGRRGHRQILFDRFAAAFGAPSPVVFELFGDEVLRHANGLSFGVGQLPTFDLKNARFVLSFGADFLGTWNSPVANSAGYGHMRQGRAGIRGTFVQVESRMTTTGANADEWVPVKPGTEGVLALGIAHVILEHKLRPAGAGGRASALIAGWAGGLTDYSPEKVAELTGVKPARLERLAHEFADQAPAVAIVAGPPLAHTNALFTALAVNALNELAGTVGRPGGLHFTPQVSGLDLDGAGRERLDRLTSSLLAGDATTKLLLVDGTNPVYASPAAWKVRDAIGKVPFVVSLASFVDETSVLADLILPDSTALESWVDALPESGALTAVIGAAAPAMKPLYDTRPAPDVLLEAAQKLQKPLVLPWPSFDAMLKATFDQLGEDAWAAAQKQGGWWGEPPKKSAGPARTPAKPAAAKADPARFVEPTFDGDAGQYPYHFLPYASLQFLDGSLSHLPWLQELPDPMTSGMWTSWVEINPTTAASLDIGQGDLVEVASSAGVLTSPAFLNPALAPNVIAMPVGQGHTTFTRYASGRGQNPLTIVAPVTETATGALAWAATRVKVSRAGDPDGTLILFSARGELREKPHEGETR